MLDFYFNDVMAIPSTDRNDMVQEIDNNCTGLSRKMTALDFIQDVPMHDRPLGDLLTPETRMALALIERMDPCLEMQERLHGRLLEAMLDVNGGSARDLVRAGADLVVALCRPYNTIANTLATVERMARLSARCRKAGKPAEDRAARAAVEYFLAELAKAIPMRHLHDQVAAE